MSIYWNKLINSIEPYVAGEQPKEGQRIIKLNTNENPYPPSPKCKEALIDLDISKLRLYPNTDSAVVCEAVASVDNVSPENVFVGNGSDEVLALCWQTFFEKDINTDKAVLIPSISYSFYPVYADFYSVRAEKIPLKEDLSIDPMDYCGKPNCGISIANPNAPTSIAMSLEDIRKILDANKESVVLIDEAYAAFAEGYTTAATLINEYKNLIVVRTLSKSYGLAGLRLGYAIGDKELIEGLKRARDSFNSYPADYVAQTLAAAALRDRENFKKNRDALIATRNRVSKELRAMGFDLPDSSSNFVFARPPMPFTAETLYKNLKAKGILVRYFNKPLINDRLRISIGTDEEMDEFLKAVREEISNGKNS